MVLETLAAQLAATRGSEEQWSRMEAALSNLHGEDGVANNEMLLTIDQAAHEIIYEAADNEFLRDVLVTHYALSLRLWYFFLSRMGDMSSAVAEHQQILLALKSRDAELAGQLMQRHIQAFQQAIQSVMSGPTREPTEVPR